MCMKDRRMVDGGLGLSVAAFSLMNVDVILV